MQIVQTHNEKCKLNKNKHTAKFSTLTSVREVQTKHAAKFGNLTNATQLTHIPKQCISHKPGAYFIFPCTNSQRQVQTKHAATFSKLASAKQIVETSKLVQQANTETK